MKYFGYIYKFTNTLTNKIYIGKREKQTFDESYYGSGREWKKALSKCGKENVKREIIEWCYSRQELNEREVYWIAFYNSTDKDIGYNVHKGGQGGNSLGDTKLWSEIHLGEKNGRYGKPTSEETKVKISKANTGRKYSDEVNKSKGRPGVKKPEGFGEKVRASRLGKTTPEETRQKISKALKGRTHETSPETRKKISNALKGRHGPSDEANGMYNKHHSEETKLKISIKNKGKFAGSKNPRARKVQCIETGKIYECIKDAIEDTGITTIGACCKGTIKICRKSGTHWRYIDED